MEISYLYGIFYPPGAEKFGSLEISNASPTQIQERIKMLQESIERMEEVELNSSRHKPATLKGFIETLKKEIAQLEQLTSNFDCEFEEVAVLMKDFALHRQRTRLESVIED